MEAPENSGYAAATKAAVASTDVSTTPRTVLLSLLSAVSFLDFEFEPAQQGC
jgi:hypothetical protein